MKASMYPIAVLGVGLFATLGVRTTGHVPGAEDRTSESAPVAQVVATQPDTSQSAQAKPGSCPQGVVCDDPAVRAGTIAAQEADTAVKQRVCSFLAAYPGPAAQQAESQPMDATKTYCYFTAAERAELIDADPDSLQKAASVARPKVMIAILPDPVHTQLALRFDESVDELQNSLQDLGWTYDRAWLPWDNKVHPEDDDFAARMANDASQAAYAKSPGVILFRSSTERQASPLVVIIVGNTPTGGVHKVPFQSAIRMWKQLTGWDRPAASQSEEAASLSILGPSFSGSIASLKSMLGDSTFAAAGATDGCPQKSLKIWVASGSVSSASTLESWNKAPDVCGGRVSIHAVSMDVDSGYEYVRLLQFLDRHGAMLRHVGDHPPKVAILTEAESEAGVDRVDSLAQRAKDSSAIRALLPSKHFFFPREISTLRAAYEQSGIFGFNSPANTVKTELHLSLGDNGNEDDTVHTFSGDQGPAALEAEMAQLAAELERQKIGIVVLSATDVLDEIFVTRYLGQHAPTVTVIVTDTDELFLRGDSSMQNAYVIGPWPLLPGNEEWSVSSRESVADHAVPQVRIHDSGLGQGLYAAVRWLVCQDGKAEICGADKGGRDVKIREYQSPFAHAAKEEDVWRTRPPLWLSAIGHSGFWPISLIDVDQSAKKERGDTTVEGPANLPPLAPAPAPAGITEPNPRSITLFTFVLAVLLLVHGLACVRARLDRGFAWSYALWHKDHRGGRFFLQLAITLAVIPALVLLKIPRESGISVRTMHYTYFNWSLQGLAVLLAMWHVLAYCSGDAWPGRLLERTSTIDPEGNATCKTSGRTTVATWWMETRAAVMTQRRFFFLSLVAIGAGVWLCNACIWDIIAPSAEKWPTERIFFLYRSAHLFCGSAPTLSLLLLGGAFVVYLVNHFNRLTFHADRIPILPACEVSPPCPGPMDVQRLTCLLSERTEPAKVGLLLAVAIILTLFMGGLRDIIPHSLAHGRFDFIVVALAAVVTVLVAHDLAVAMMAWFLLRSDCLLKLKFSPMRWGFTWIKGWSWRKIWAPGATSPYRIYDYFERLWESNERQIKDAPLEAAYRNYWVRFADTPRDGAWADDVTTLMGEVHQALAVAASAKLAHLATLWAADFGPITGWKETERGLSRDIPLSKDLFGDSGDGSVSAEWVATQERVGEEEFVALVYLGYIRLVLLQIRSRVMTASAMYVLLLWSLTSYPFLNHHYVLVGLSCLMGALALIVMGIYSQMHRDDILSRTTETQSGELGSDFFTKVLPMVGVPLLTLIASQFPEISNLIFSWLEPGLSSMK